MHRIRSFAALTVPVAFAVLAAIAALLSTATLSADVSEANAREANAREANADATLSAMTLAEKVGQMITIALPYPSGEPRETVSADVAELIQRVRPGGVILYGYDVDTVEQVTALIGSLQAHSEQPLLIATDHEGGDVNRLVERSQLPATRTPSAQVVGAAGDPELARRLGHVVGRELRALGITVCFCPVADVRGPSMIASRFFSNDPQRIGELAAAMTTGLHDARVLAVPKHFPGLGGAPLDTHIDPTATHDSLAVVRDRDISPFVHVLAERPGGIMLAHHGVSALDPSNAPATVSAPIVTNLLRRTLGFEGVVFTDALNMRAVTQLFGTRELVVRAVAAGVDMLVAPVSPVTARDAIVAAVADGRIRESRIDASVRRIIAAKTRVGLWTDAGLIVPDSRAAHAVLGAPEHRELVETIEREATASAPK